MKRLAILILSLLIVVAYMGMGAAQQSTPPSQEKPAEKPAEKGGEKKPEKKARLTRIIGEVTAVDAQAKTITIKTKKAEEVTLSLSDKTKIMSGKKKKEISDVKSGDRVTAAVVEEDGKTVAHSIRVSTPKGGDGAKKEEGKKENGIKETPKAEKAPETK